MELYLLALHPKGTLTVLGQDVWRRVAYGLMVMAQCPVASSKSKLISVGYLQLLIRAFLCQIRDKRPESRF